MESREWWCSLRYYNIRLRWSRGSGGAALVITYDAAGVEEVVVQLSLEYTTPMESGLGVSQVKLPE